MASVKRISVEEPEVHLKRITKNDVYDIYNYHEGSRLLKKMLIEDMITEHAYNIVMKDLCKKYRPELTSLYEQVDLWKPQSDVYEEEV